LAISFRLREVLEKRAMSQSELARKSGVSFATINRLCTNSTAQVSLGTLDRLCTTLGVPPADLLDAALPARKGRGRQNP
jgi:DNA-binding Xre family transcriptional regulator